MQASVESKYFERGLIVLGYQLPPRFHTHPCLLCSWVYVATLNSEHVVFTLTEVEGVPDDILHPPPFSRHDECTQYQGVQHTNTGIIFVFFSP